MLTTYSGSVDSVVADASFTDVDEPRSVDELCDALFTEHLDESLRVLMIAGRADRTTDPHLRCSYTSS